MKTQTNKCSGCGAVFEEIDGPTHRYMISSPACWQAFGKLLAAEYSAPALMATHRLSVDAYAVQHPGGHSRQAIQSVGLHLARLLIQLDRPLAPQETNEVMLKFGRRKKTLQYLAPPASFDFTIADVVPHIGAQTHSETVRYWAQSACASWRDHHPYIQAWIGKAN